MESIVSSETLKRKLKTASGRAGMAVSISLGLLISLPGLAQIPTRIMSNTDFELPEIDSTCGNDPLQPSFNIIDQALVPNWSTDAAPSALQDCGPPGQPSIEIWQDTVFGIDSNTGAQHMELNGTEPARIYQEVCLLANEAIAYSYFHRNRNGTIDESSQAVLFDGTGTILIDNGPVDIAPPSAPPGPPVNPTIWVEHTGTLTNDGTAGLRQIGLDSLMPGFTVGNFIDSSSWDVSPFVDVVDDGDVMQPEATIGTQLISFRVSGTLDNPATFTLTLVAGSTASPTSDFTVAVAALARGTVDSFNGTTGEIQITLPAGDYDPNMAMDGDANQGVIRVPIMISDDADAEPDETIAYEFSAVTVGGGNSPARDLNLNNIACDGGPISTTTGTITIVNDDGSDLSVDKTLDTAPPFTATDVIQYTITVTNNGPNDAVNVSVTDTPTNLTINSVSSTNCAAFPCTIPSLLNGNSEVITVMATINMGGAFDNSVTVDLPAGDPDPSNNTDNTGNGGTAAPAADLSITKTLDTAGPFFTGTPIQYTIVVQNNGPDIATNVVITDTPTNITINTVSSPNCSGFPCNIASLGIGVTETITVNATIDGPGAFDNGASVSASEADPVPGNNDDANGNGGTALPLADLTIEKTLDTPAPYFAGGTVTFTIVVENLGPDDATNVVVTDTPDNLAILDATSPNCAGLPCTIPTLANGATETITVQAQILGPGAFDNAADVTADETDPDAANNADAGGNGGTAEVFVVPTMTFWGLMAMALALLVVARRQFAVARK